ncbi:receptor-interacting serine/threonine-protein kinase 1-like isoform X1 [Anguilla rostrata]|uniref:receptor-interacting serine/threonine-protein kinase 1-like isoform X1 n=2 Tax=Anguilla rostrata TaxID=7938 RepID=UPI0030CD2E56
MAVNQRSPLIAPADLLNKVALDSAHFGHDLYLSHHKTHGPVLIKTLYTGRLLSESKRKSLLTEVEPLLRLNHSRVLGVLGVVLDDGPSFLVMQFTPIGNLSAVLEEGTVPVSIKGRIILDILDGMVYLTNSDIVHGDLKPQNILVGEDFHIKIADLELASCRSWSKLTMEESRRRSRKGVSRRACTLCYIAPENRETIHAPFTQKSDVYSFAIIVWVILTHKEPDSLDSGPDENLVPPSSPMGMVTLMKNCWVQDPNKRPTFEESYKIFQCFYSDELEKNLDKDLRLKKCIVDTPGIHTNNSQRESPDLVTKMSAVALTEPCWQTDAPGGSREVPRDALRLESLQTDARILDRRWAPHGSFLSSPDLSAPPAPAAGRPPVPTQASLKPQPWPGEDPPAAPPDVTMRGKKPEGPGGAETGPGWAPQHPSQRIRSWPVFPEPGAHGCGAGADSARSLHRQRSAGVVIQYATAVQIGDNNRLTLEMGDSGEDGFQPSFADCPHYEELLQTYEDRAVRREHLDLLARNIGRNWKSCARALGLTDVEVQTIGYDYSRDGLAEMVHQTLEKWQMKTGTVGCTTGALCRALRGSVGVDVLCQLLRMCQGGATP